MELAWRHSWQVSPAEARLLQQEVSRRVILTDDLGQGSEPVSLLPERLVAVDVGYDKHTDRCGASLIVWSTTERRVLARDWNVQPSTFPYIPGYLSFREIPALLPLFERLDWRPSLILCDGQGIAHPRRAGLATHLGVVLDCLTLGWAKSRLIGVYEEPPEAAGAATPLTIGAEQVGWVLRSRTRVAPTFVSPGHRLSMLRALEIARALLGPCRLCEPARQAHQLTREIL